jgi:hypothetical protein
MSEGQILNMLERGTITADEAAKLLEAVAARDIAAESGVAAGEGAAAEEPIAVGSDQVIPGSFAPEAKRWKRIQQIPLAISLLVLITSAWGLYAVYHRADARITLGWVAVLVVFLVAVLATVLSAWVITAPWLHVRIHEPDGKRIAISLPIPLTLADWGLRIARRYVDEHSAAYLDTSAEFLRAMRRDRKTSEPIVVNIDEDGHYVQVYIG